MSKIYRTRASRSRRHALVGLLLVAAGIFGPEAAPVATAAVTLGGLLAVFGPISTRIEGQVEVGSKGVKATVTQIYRATVGPEGEENPRVIAEAKAELPVAHGQEVSVAKLFADAMSNGWTAAQTSGVSTVTLARTYLGREPLALPGRGPVNPADIVTVVVPAESLVGAAPKPIVEIVEALSAAAKS